LLIGFQAVPAADDPEEPAGYRGRRRRRVPLAGRIAVVGIVALLAVIGVGYLLPDRVPATAQFHGVQGASTSAPDTTTPDDPVPPSGTRSSATRPASAWQANRPYRIGDRVSYAGHDYQCLQAHTSLPGWEPPNAPALWQALP
jgi:hypothetical protein